LQARYWVGPNSGFTTKLIKWAQDHGLGESEENIKTYLHARTLLQVRDEKLIHNVEAFYEKHTSTDDEEVILDTFVKVEANCKFHTVRSLEIITNTQSMLEKSWQCLINFYVKKDIFK
jgi:hypothetical protein